MAFEDEDDYTGNKADQEGLAEGWKYGEPEDPNPDGVDSGWVARDKPTKHLNDGVSDDPWQRPDFKY